MRPMFADTIVTETDFDDLARSHGDGGDRVDRSARAEAYREWRRTRVLFMQSVCEAERAVVHEVADLPAQRRGADL
jgi:hypothetical protein